MIEKALLWYLGADGPEKPNPLSAWIRITVLAYALIFGSIALAKLFWSNS
jgi:hypothetical protein